MCANADRPHEACLKKRSGVELQVAANSSHRSGESHNGNPVVKQSRISNPAPSGPSIVSFNPGDIRLAVDLTIVNDEFYFVAALSVGHERGDGGGDISDHGVAAAGLSFELPAISQIIEIGVC